MKSTHPFEPYIPADSEKLIIGTIPPPRFCKEPYQLYENDVNFYYGSRDNYFWCILEELFQIKLEYSNTEQAVQQRKDLLRKLKIGITDIVDSCIHVGDSAADSDLKEIKQKDIKSLLQIYPAIDTLIYTSEFVKKLMNDHFNTYHSIVDPSNRKKQSVKIDSKEYQVKILYSPSPSALRNLGKDGAERRKEQYREFLTKD
jgi:hypoxanthine-DNA glycosylase